MTINRQHLDTRLASLLPYIRDVLSGYGVTRFYIGGGFLRDTLLDVEPKDIDVFIHARSCGDILSACDGEYNKPAEEYIDQEVVAVGTIETTGIDWPLEIIILGDTIGDDVDSIIDRFDTAICKVAVEDTGNVVISKEFLDDVENKTITICRCNGATTDRLKERLSRLTDKFPKYTVMDPDFLLEAVVPFDFDKME